MLTLFPVVEAMSMPSIRRTQSPNAVSDACSDEYVARIEGKWPYQIKNYRNSPCGARHRRWQVFVYFFILIVMWK